MLRIKEAREARGWTQEQLAEAVNTTQQTIQRWESGQTDVKSNQIKAISKALGVTVSFIMNVNDDDDENTITMSADEEELIACYRKMGDAERQHILFSARAYAAFSNPDKEWVDQDGHRYRFKKI